VPIVINSDAHSPQEVAWGFAEALKLARAVGYRQVVRFSRRQRTAVDLDP